MFIERMSLDDRSLFSPVLGLSIMLRRKDRQIYDTDNDRVITSAAQAEKSIIAYLDDPQIQSAADFQGEHLLDWEHFLDLASPHYF